MGSFLRDLRYALRMSAKTPAFTAVAVLTLALGIGATVASFSLFEAVEWNWLPYPNVDRIMWLGEAQAKEPTYLRDFSGRDYLELKQQNRSFSRLGAYDWSHTGTLLTPQGPQVVSTPSVTNGIFEVLGARPALGRLFTEEEEKGANSPVAVLTYDTWQGHFDGDARIIGKTITLDGEKRTIIGVLRKGFHWWDAEVFIPIATDSADFQDPDRFRFLGLGRLAPGATRDSAAAEVKEIITRLQPQEPSEHQGYTGWMWRLTDTAQYMKRRLYLFLGAAFLVLLIACVNVANLLLARAVERQTEFAVRSALGAGRAALVRQLLAESLLLALFGAGLGILFAGWGLRALTVVANPTDAGVIPKNTPLTVDWRVVLFAAGVAILTAVLFGAAPGVIASRVDPDRWLKAGTRSQTGSRSRTLSRDALVIGEVSLALVLTAAGGLFLRSLSKLQHAGLGFNSTRLLTLHLELSGWRYHSALAVRQFYDDLLQKARATAGVEGAVVANQLPMTSGWQVMFTVVGGAPAHPTNLRNRGALERAVSTDYFRVMQIPLVHGRAIGPQDTGASARVIVISESLARRYFGSENPLGHEVMLDLNTHQSATWTASLDYPKEQPFTAEIVGIARNVHEIGINEVEFDSIYIPFAQHPEPEAYLAVRTNADPQAMGRVLRTEINSLDPTLPVYGLPTMEERIQKSLGGDRFNAAMIAILAGLALLLALVGIFAVIAYTVNQRVHEIGIRIALGAKSGDVLASIVSRSGQLVMIGVAGGVAASLIIGKLLGDALYLVPTKHEGMLYGVTLHDPLTLVAAGVLLTATALAASYFPARRATKIDPMEALRAE